MLGGDGAGEESTVEDDGEEGAKQDGDDDWLAEPACDLVVRKSIACTKHLAIVYAVGV